MYRIVPHADLRIPEIVVKRVVFPAPFGPMIATVSHPIPKEIPEIASTAPYRTFKSSTCKMHPLFIGFSKVCLYDFRVPLDLQRSPLRDFAAEIEDRNVITDFPDEVHVMLYD